jgi:hypothetical protein
MSKYLDVTPIRRTQNLHACREAKYPITANDCTRHQEDEKAKRKHRFKVVISVENGIQPKEYEVCTTYSRDPFK